MDVPRPLTDEQLASLVDEFAGDHVHAVVLTGSYARGDAGPLSDVDLKCFVHGGTKPRDRFGYRHGRFVNVASGTVEERLDALRDPGEAIWAVPTFREMRILLDREGRAEALRQAAMAFSWVSLPGVDEYVALGVTFQVESIHKVIDGLTSSQADRTIGATWEMLSVLTRAMAVHHRLLVPSDRVYFRLVREAVGAGSAWTQEHRLAAGVADVSWVMRGVAVLRLYRESAALLRPVLDDEYRAAVYGGLELIEAFLSGR